MANCFQNFRAEVSKGIIAEWFEELEGFDFFHVRNAFKTYVRENEKFPPTLATIIRLSKKSFGNDNDKPKETFQKCFINNCTENADERRGIAGDKGLEHDVWMCGKHSEQLFLRNPKYVREHYYALRRS